MKICIRCGRTGHSSHECPVVFVIDHALLGLDISMDCGSLGTRRESDGQWQFDELPRIYNESGRARRLFGAEAKITRDDISRAFFAWINEIRDIPDRVA